MTSEQRQESVVNNNINEIEKILNASSQYISIGAGTKSVLQFLPQNGITEVEKIYNDQRVKSVKDNNV